MKMFKKKSELLLPPLPKAPNHEQMIEDINAADLDDPVFLEGSCKKMFEERSKVDIKFQTVKEVIEARQRLNNLITELDGKLVGLKSSKCELQEITENIKQQADKALK